MWSSRSRFIFERVSGLKSFNNSLDRFRIWHLLTLLFEAPECNFVRTGSKILFNYVGTLFSVFNEGWTYLTKNSVLTDYLKVGLRVNSNGPRMKPQLEFS